MDGLAALAPKKKQLLTVSSQTAGLKNEQRGTVGTTNSLGPLVQPTTRRADPDVRVRARSTMPCYSSLDQQVGVHGF